MSEPWPMLHRDARHTGVAPGVGRIPRFGPVVKKWEWRVAPPVTPATLSCYRFYSGFPLVDLDGNGILDVVVTGPDNAIGPDCPPPGVPDLTQGTVRALRTAGPGQAAALWSFAGSVYLPAAQPQWGCSDWFDQYSAVAVHADADPIPDIVFTSKGGIVRAVSGQTGALIWQYATGRFIEAGPMVADLDGDGHPEILVVTGIPVHDCTPTGAGLLIFQARPPQGSSTNPPIREVNFPQKLDSQEPAIVELNPPGGQNSQTIVFGAWDGYLYAVWFDLSSGDLATAPVHAQDRIALAEIARGTEGALDPAREPNPIVRSSPLIWNFGLGETAVFGWMGSYTDIESSRISAVRLAYHDNPNPQYRRVEFTPLWTHKRVPVDGVAWPVMDWKPSVALLPRPGAPPLVVSAGGKGRSEANQTGSYGVCTPAARGWVGAFRHDGTLAWARRYVGEGNIRASCAVADLDGDGHYEVVVPFGCRGQVRCYGDDGTERWTYQLGDPAAEWTQRAIASPSIGDVDGDGFLEVVVSAFDGKVYCLGAP
jgi:hypothetical protein